MEIPFAAHFIVVIVVFLRISEKLLLIRENDGTRVHIRRNSNAQIGAKLSDLEQNLQTEKVFTVNK